MRKDITFKTEDGVTLRGWFYQPDDRDGPFPTLVMAHGFSAIKEQGLKVQSALQDRQIRVTGKSRDELQAVIAFCRAGSFSGSWCERPPNS